MTIKELKERQRLEDQHTNPVKAGAFCISPDSATDTPPTGSATDANPETVSTSSPTRKETPKRSARKSVHTKTAPRDHPTGTPNNPSRDHPRQQPTRHQASPGHLTHRTT